MSEYKTYVELFDKASKKSIQDILDSEFFQKVESAIAEKRNYCIEKEYKQKMCNFIKADSDRVIDRKLRHNLVRQYLWTKKDVHKLHYNIFSILSECAKKELTIDSEDWINAIAIAIFGVKNKIIRPYNDIGADELYIKNLYTSQFYSVESCRFFKGKGFKISIKNGEIKFGNIKDIFSSLDYRAEQLGFFLYEFIIIFINQNLLGNEGKLYKFHTSSAQNEELLPVGLLYQLALKHIDKKSCINQHELYNKIKEFLIFIKKFASLFELQLFGHDFELMFMRETESIFEKLQEFVLRDNFYKIEQYNSDDVIDFVKYLANYYANNKKYKNDIDKFIIMVDFFKSQVNFKNGFIFFEKKDIPEEIDDNFFNFFCFKTINQQFNTINDFDKVDFKAKPFVEINGKYLIIQPQFSAISLYVILCSILNNDREIGFLIEKYIVNELKKRKIDVIYGKKYKVSQRIRNALSLKSEELECDIVLQSEKYIFFIEIKKKELTREAKSGDIFFILKDLSKSLLASQTQANKHMRYLKENSEIKFNKDENGIEEILNLKNRDIIKISLTTIDYLSLHSKEIHQKFMRLLYNKELVISNDLSERQEKIVTEFNKCNNEFGIELSGVHSIHQLNSNKLHDCYFLNLFHLLFLLKNIDNIEDFSNTLLRTRNIITNTGDFYYENSYISKLQGYVNKPKECLGVSVSSFMAQSAYKKALSLEQAETIYLTQSQRNGN